MTAAALINSCEDHFLFTCQVDACQWRVL